jgi:hypothetical protein
MPYSVEWAAAALGISEYGSMQAGGIQLTDDNNDEWMMVTAVLNWCWATKQLAVTEFIAGGAIFGPFQHFI